MAFAVRSIHRRPILRAFNSSLILIAVAAGAAAAQMRPESPLARKLIAEATEVLASAPSNERMQLSQMVVQYYLQRYDLDNAMEVAVQLGAPGHVFGNIASSYLDRGNFAMAMRVAQLAGDSTRVNEAISSLASRLGSMRRHDEMRALIATIGSPEMRVQAMMNAANSVYPRDSSTNALIREALVLARADTSPNARWRIQELTGMLVDRGDWSAVRELDAATDAPVERLQFIVGLAQRLRNNGEQRTMASARVIEARVDSLYRVARKLIDVTEDPRQRSQMLRTFAQSYVAGPADSNYVKIAATFDDVNARNTYLSRVAAYRARQGDAELPLRIGEEILQRGDTAQALALWSDAANSFSSGYRSSIPVGDPGPGRIFDRISTVVQASGNNQRYRHYRDNSWAQLVRWDPQRIRKVIADSGINQISAWGQDVVINSLMQTDLRAALKLVRGITDTTRADNHLRSISDRQTNAGYLDDAAETIAMIRSAGPRIQARLQIAQHRLNAGDTTGVRATVQDVMTNMEPARDQWHMNYLFPMVVIRVGMVDEVITWSRTLPDVSRAHVIVGLASRMNQ